MCTCHGVGPMTSPRTAILYDVRVFGPACRSVNTLDLTLTGSSNGANVHTSQCERLRDAPESAVIIVRQGVRETLDFPGVQRHSPRVRDSRVRVTGRCDCACPCGATTWRCPRGCRRRGPMPRTHLPDRMFSTRYTATHASADASAPVQPLRARLSGNFSGPSPRLIQCPGLPCMCGIGCGGFSASGRRFPHAPTGTCVHNAPKRRARNGAPQPVDHDDSACAFSDAGDPRPACRLQLDELVHLRRASETPCAQHVRMPRSRCLRSACGRARVARSASARKTGRRSDRPPSHTPRGRRRAPGRSGRCT